MKIQFLETGPSYGPIIRLFDFELPDVKKLLRVCLDLAEKRIMEFRFEDQPWVETVQSCRFHWVDSPRDIGVMMPDPRDPFVLWYSEEAWLEVHGKMKPFAKESSGFNWLTVEGEVRVLISRDGTW